MNKRAKTTHRRSLPDSAFLLVFPYLDLKDHSRFARSCKYALTQSGLTEESTRRCVWDKHMTLDVKAGDESFDAFDLEIDTLGIEMDRFNKFTSICKPTCLRLAVGHAWFNVRDVSVLETMPLKCLSLHDSRRRKDIFIQKEEIDLGFLLGLVQLQKLVLEGVVFSGAHFELLKGKRLTELSLPHTRNGYITDVTMISALARDFPALRVLSIPNLLSHLEVPVDVLDKQLKSWSSFTQLEVLDVSYSLIESLGFVRKLPKLKSLSINHCKKLTDDSFEALVGQPDLCEVNFSYIEDLTQASAKHLGCLSLTTVTFRHYSMTDEWVEKLLLSHGPRPVVEKVVIYEGDHVTTKALSCLEGLPSLLELCLCGCSVSDLSPLLLLHLKSLQLQEMLYVEWATLHGLVCGTVFIDRCTIQDHVTVELLRRTGGDVLVHIEVRKAEFIYPWSDGSFVHRTIMSPPLLR